MRRAPCPAHGGDEGGVAGGALSLLWLLRRRRAFPSSSNSSQPGGGVTHPFGKPSGSWPGAWDRPTKASVRSAWIRLALVRSALNRLAPVRLAPVRVPPETSLSLTPSLAPGSVVGPSGHTETPSKNGAISPGEAIPHQAHTKPTGRVACAQGWAVSSLEERR